MKLSQWNWNQENKCLEIKEKLSGKNLLLNKIKNKDNLRWNKIKKYLKIKYQLITSSNNPNIEVVSYLPIKEMQN